MLSKFTKVALALSATFWMASANAALMHSLDDALAPGGLSTVSTVTNEGTVSIVGSLTEGSGATMADTTGGSTGADLATFANTNAGDLATALGISLGDGSGFQFSFSANTGGNLEFDWAFMTNEINGFSQPDSAFYTLFDGTTTITGLMTASAFGAGDGALNGFSRSTSGHESVAIGAGNYILTFGVVETNATNIASADSALAVDFVQFDGDFNIPIPVPGPLLLMGVGLLGVVARKRQI